MGCVKGPYQRSEHMDEHESSPEDIVFHDASRSSF